MNLASNTLLVKIILVVSLSCFVTTVSFANTTTTSTTGRFTYLQKDEPAPFDGTLFDPVAVAKILADRQTAQRECELRLQYQKEVREAECKRVTSLLISELEIEKKKYDLIVKAQQDEIEALRKLAKGDNNTLWVSIGFALGAISSVAIFFAAVEISQ